MSNDYPLVEDISLFEQSCRFEIAIGEDGQEPVCSKEFTTLELQRMIVKMIHVLSYYSEDCQDTLDRFNVKMQDTL